jgi:hypothetical protein
MPKIEKLHGDEGKWGIRDSCDFTWYGDDEGPVTYNDQRLAFLAAAIITKATGRKTQAIEYDGGPKHLKDHIDMNMTPLEALKALERGEL